MDRPTGHAERRIDACREKAARRCRGLHRREHVSVLIVLTFEPTGPSRTAGRWAGGVDRTLGGAADAAGLIYEVEVPFAGAPQRDRAQLGRTIDTCAGSFASRARHTATITCVSLSVPSSAAGLDRLTRLNDVSPARRFRPAESQTSAIVPEPMRCGDGT